MIQKLGSYQILGILCAGGRPLYKAQAADKRMVALKTMPANGVTPEERERFQREAEICAGLDHPNLLKVQDAGEADGILYQVMDLLEGSDLAKLFGGARVFSWEEKLSIMQQVCAGLDFAHKRNLVHRDIKPANIFVETSGNVRILDFGMARICSSNLTQVGATLGTVNYMAPEQIRGETCTAASDVFSSAIVFYQLASGRHPFSKAGSGLAQIVSAIVFEAAPPLNRTAPGAPEGLEFVLNKALEKEPAKRWKDAGDFKQALDFCRLTLRMAAASPAAGQGQSPAAAQPDMDKTVIMHRPMIPVPLSRRPSPPTPPPQPPAPLKPAGAVPKPPAPHVYCAACTAANPPGTLTCSKCGVPLSTFAPPLLPPPAGIPWRAITFTAGAVILFLIAAMVFLLRR